MKYKMSSTRRYYEQTLARIKKTISHSRYVMSMDLHGMLDEDVFSFSADLNARRIKHQWFMGSLYLWKDNDALTVKLLYSDRITGVQRLYPGKRDQAAS